jgi:hypothetical protein
MVVTTLKPWVNTGKQQPITTSPKIIMDQASPLLAHSLTDSAQRAIRASKDHQYALKLYTERLEAELQTVDKLLVCLSPIQSFQRRHFIA